MSWHDFKRMLMDIRLFRPLIRTLPRRHLKLEGDRGIMRIGHREYVGGSWDSVGRLQFEFLVRRGLQPHHTLLDIACGALRAGVHLVPYLNRHNYFGIDKEAGLIEAGLRHELPLYLLEEKQPRLVVSGGFDFEQLQSTFDCALAHSLFTHLTSDDIQRCLRRLRPHIAKGGVLYATFLECEQPQQNPHSSHAHDKFRYTQAEMNTFGIDCGWQMQYIGDWGHPHGQIMVRYTPSQDPLPSSLASANED